MAIAKKLEDEISRSTSRSSSSLLNEALLIDSTMYIIGLQVHVHFKDGSIFSGIFYTISLENEFSIVLKNTKLIKKGRSKSNVSSGKIVETLVILSSNIVQIVAEDENVVSAVADFASDPRSCIANKSINSGYDTRGSNHRRNSARLENRLENKVKTLKSGKDQVSRILSPSCTEDAMKDSGRIEGIRISLNKHHPSSLNNQRQEPAF